MHTRYSLRTLTEFVSEKYGSRREMFLKILANF